MNKAPGRYQCVIVDDEPHAIEIIEHHLGYFKNYEVAETFRDGFSALTWMKTQVVDLLFLDIQMPGISGIEMLKVLGKKTAVFLTTAYRHYAPEAFEFEVLDYLLKPISGERFRKAIQKFEQSRLAISGVNQDKVLIIRSNRADVHVQASSILYLEAMGDYVRIHTTDDAYLTKESLKSILERLPGVDFRQVHRSFIVNMHYVRQRKSHELIIRDRLIPIGRSYRF